MQRVVPVLRVARLDAAERFYTEQLGFTTDWIWRPDAASRGFAQLSRGGLSIYVSDQPDGAPRGSAEVYLAATQKGAPSTSFVTGYGPKAA